MMISTGWPHSHLLWWSGVKEQFTEGISSSIVIIGWVYVPCVTVALVHLDDNANATQAYEQAVKLDVWAILVYQYVC